MSAWGAVERARDLKRFVRLDDLRAQEELPEVEAALLTTHDLDLRFVATELLPGLLLDPTEIPAGLGPGHRTYRAPMVDLPPCAIVYAPEAATNCELPWRPPSLHVCPYRNGRRQHAKIAVVLYRVNDERWVRLVAGSANLTRRGFAANLEVAAFEDYPLGRKFASLCALRKLLEALENGSSLAESSAWRTLMDALPSGRCRRTDEELHFIHSAIPRAYQDDIAEWLDGTSDHAGEYARSVLVSPFFPAKGLRLKKFFARDLSYAEVESSPIDLIVDGRESAVDDVRNGAEPFTTPPAWLADYRGEGSGTYRPAFVKRIRRDNRVAGTGEPGRVLHAKLFAVGHHRKRARLPRLVWRILLGSSNFTEAGYGLLGENSNLEAGFLIEHHEDEPNDLFGERPKTRALCTACELDDAEEDRSGARITDILAAAAPGKHLLRALDAGAVTVTLELDGKYRVAIDLTATDGLPDELRLGTGQVFEQRDGVFEAVVDSLAPYCLTARLGDQVVQWPLPTSLAGVEVALLAAAGAHRRSDRLLDYWLRRADSLIEPDDDELSADPLVAVGAAPVEDNAPLGSWRLNRLVLGARRRLAESVAARNSKGKRTYVRLPRAEVFLASVRTRELLAMMSSLDPADCAYAGTLFRAALWGYASADSKPRFGFVRSEQSALVQGWMREEAWQEFNVALATSRAKLPASVVDAIDEAAEVFFESVRAGEVVP